ncbi:MAG TPA: AAA family ATPase, partial [Pedococcus sp.]|nr:AAA family ATPase [Pedococcus sp.]
MTLHKFLAQLTAAGLYTPPEVSHPGLGNGVPPGPPPSPGDPQAVRYAHAALVAESHKVASQPEGVRNSELVRSAYRMGQLVGSGYLDRMAVYDDLLRAAEASGLGAGEARATILSGLSAGMGAPRAVALRAEVGPAHTVVAEGASVAPPEAVEEAASVAASVASVAPDLGKRLVPGGAFIHSAPTSVPAVWGRGGEVLWAEGEPLIITGPTGVGKTTLGGMIIAGRLGLIPAVLGYPVRPGARRTLVLAMDRPAQIQRALARLLRAWPAELLDEKLIVWKGPPPADLARHPQTLLSLAEQAQADTVVIDSLKDAAVKLSDEETGQGLSRAMNLCVANQVEVLGYHHQTK